MSKTLKLLAMLAAMLIVFGACDGESKPLTIENIPDVYTVEKAESDGCFIERNGRNRNVEVLKDFISDVTAGSDSEIMCVSYTKNDDAVLTHISYQSGIFTVQYDSMRDRTGVQQTYSETYEYLNILELSTQTWVVLSNCKDLTASEYEDMILSSNSADWIPHFFVCAYAD